MFNPSIAAAPPESGQSGAEPAYPASNPVFTPEINSAADVGAFTANAFGFQPNAYKIEWKGSPNFWSGRDGHTAVAICDHIMQGTMEATDAWFKNRRSDVSSHFGVGRNGQIWQWVRSVDSAWANGIYQLPDTSLDWLADAYQKKINPNSITISIEHEGYSGTPFTEEQYKATLWLHSYLCVTHKIQPDRYHVVGHYQITGRDRAGCPGPAFPWQRLLQDLTDLAKPAVASGGDTSASQKKWTDGVTGIVFGDFGPGKVKTSNSYVRSRPSLSSQDNTLLRKLGLGTSLRFSGYTDAGPAFKGNGRWFLIADEDGGGWVHSSMIG